MYKSCLTIIALGVTLYGCSAQAGGTDPTPVSPTPTASETATPSPAASESPAASPSESASPSAAGDKYRGLVPFAGVKAPEVTEAVPVLMKTDAGDLTIEVYPQAAPNSAKRFLELVNSGFYNDTPIFRVIRSPKPFMAQFGVNSSKAGEREKTFKEDPTMFQLDRGTLAFAKTGMPDSASTQVFINYGNNDFLRDQNFTVFARVTKGMENADKWKEGELDQMSLWTNGPNYLKSLPSQPNKIISMEVIKPKPDKK